jgi:hypothetical protein
VGVAPTAIQNKALGHMDLVTYLAGGGSTASPVGLVVGSDVISTMNSTAAQSITTTIGQWPGSGRKAWVLVDPPDGAIGEVAPGGRGLPVAHAVRAIAVVRRACR